MGIFSKLTSGTPFSANRRQTRKAGRSPRPAGGSQRTDPSAAEAKPADRSGPPSSARSGDQAASLRAAVAERQAPPLARHASANGNGHHPPPNGSHTNRPAQPAAATEPSDQPLAGRLASTTDDDIRPLRNKQELFDELQRNYRDLVALVRKVDSHLDTQTERSKSLAEIAERVDRTLPAIERLGETPDKLDELRNEINTIVKQNKADADQRAARIEKVVSDVVGRLEAQARDQHQLVSTMAEFRETIGELSSSTRESGVAVRELARSVRERDQALVGQITSVKRRVTVGFAAVAVIAGAAAVLAAIALTA